MKFLYPFEDEGPEPLAYLPLCVRYRLDLAGLRLSLKAWQALPFPRRQALCILALDLECDASRWKAELLEALHGSGMETPPECPAVLPDEFVAEKIPELVAAHLQAPPTESGHREAAGPETASITWLARWRGLTEIDRYALWKTAQSKRGAKLFHEVAKFFGIKPCSEFGP